MAGRGAKRAASRRLSVPFLAAVLALAPGCFVFERATVGVGRVGPERIEAELETSALTGSRPSAGALLALHYFGLSESFERRPEEALVALHRALAAEPSRKFVVALSELCYLVAKRTGSREHYLGAAVYAYLYLFGDEWEDEPNPYDRRFRWACELYNRGLRQALLDEDGRELRLEGGRRALPLGTLELELDLSDFPARADLALFPADDYEVWGLSLRVRDSGLGVPAVARAPDSSAGDSALPAKVRTSTVPVTLFLRLAGNMSGLEGGIPATLELRRTLEAQSVRVGTRDVPLEADLSAALAMALDRAELWKLGLPGFFGGGGSRREKENGIHLVQPYEPGRIPVLFVHGTASNPANWAEMFNLLASDPLLRHRYQYWFYSYSTGVPLPFSSARLRDELRALVTALDPEGRDPALRRMVLVGHSQGGLLVKMMVVDGSLEWWTELFGQPLEEMGLAPELEERVRDGLEFDPLPFVERVVFLATPHRGSYLADKWYARILRAMITVPREVKELGDAVLRDAVRLPRGMERRIPTSLDSMTSGNPFLARLERAPIVSRVKAHSIIPVGDAGPDELADARDGVVSYASAHLAGVESELCIAAGHSCQGDPAAIREVRRILRLHLEEEGSSSAEDAEGGRGGRGEEDNGGP